MKVGFWVGLTFDIVVLLVFVWKSSPCLHRLFWAIIYVIGLRPYMSLAPLPLLILGLTVLRNKGYFGLVRPTVN